MHQPLMADQTVKNTRYYIHLEYDYPFYLLSQYSSIKHNHFCAAGETREFMTQLGVFVLKMPLKEH